MDLSGRVTNKRQIEDFTRFFKKIRTILGQNKSEVVRQVLSQRASAFMGAPFYSHASHSFVLVQKDRTVLNLQQSRLYTNEGIDSLPLSMSFNEDKRFELSEFGFGRDFLELWLLNAFSCWSSTDDFSESPKLTIADDTGVSKKFVRLDVNCGQQEFLGIETLNLIQNYALQRSVLKRISANPGDDHADFDIIFPSFNAEFFVVVDLDLYGDNPQRREAATASHELRFLNGTTWSQRSPRAEEFPPVWEEGKVAGGEEGDKNILRDLDQLCLASRRRALALMESSSLKDKSVSPKMTEGQVDRIRLPEEFLYGKLFWPMPPAGMRVSLTWNMAP